MVKAIALAHATGKDHPRAKALDLGGTLSGMGQATGGHGKVARTKSVPEPVARAFREQLRTYVDEHHDGNQTGA